MKKNGKTSGIAKAAFIFAVICGLAAISAGLGTRYEVWNFRVGLAVFRWAAYGGVAAVLLSLIGLLATVRLVFKHGFVPALLGLVAGGALVIVSWQWMQLAKRVPPIHDVTTDTGSPPEFVTILPLRKSASNPADYGGFAIAAQQHRAYPDIVPLVLNIPPEAAFEMALAASRRMEWKIIDANRGDGRIEAFDTTFWFGFKDDIVIRVKKEGQGSRIDIRSVSRVGISDVGKNANRIRMFFREMGKK